MDIDRDALAEAIGEEHEGRPSIHIVGKGWIPLPAYVRQEIADAVIAHLTAASGESEYQCDFQLDQCRCGLRGGHEGLHECSNHRFTSREMFTGATL